MAELFILEFDGFGEAVYDKVNEILGIDQSTDEGDWPAGLVSHSAGPIEDGWIVIEVWETREDQDEFMKSRLGPALHQAGVDKPPKRAQWTKAKSHRSPRRPSAHKSAAGA
jgi:hypothetical protein